MACKRVSVDGQLVLAEPMAVLPIIRVEVCRMMVLGDQAWTVLMPEKDNKSSSTNPHTAVLDAIPFTDDGLRLLFLLREQQLLLLLP